jgi:Flp pilus assembly protein CpaB
VVSLTEEPKNAELAPAPVRVIKRRVSLPTGRAVVGALLVTLAVVGLFTTYRRAQADNTTAYVVVAQPIQAGAVINADDVTTRLLELAPDIGRRTHTNPSSVIGSTAIQSLTPGQLVQEATILQPGSAASPQSRTVEVSFAIDRSRALNGQLLPGEVVDIVATIDRDGEACSGVVAPLARVVSVRGGSDEVISTSNSITVTVALEADQSVLGVIYSADEAEVTLIRSTRSQSQPVEGSFCGTPTPPPASEVAAGEGDSEGTGTD